MTPLRRSQEPETVRQHFQHTVAVDALAALGQGFQDGEDQFLLAKTVGVVDTVGGGKLEKLGNGFLLEFGKMHGMGLGGLA